MSRGDEYICAMTNGACSNESEYEKYRLKMRQLWCEEMREERRETLIKDAQKVQLARFLMRLFREKAISQAEFSDGLNAICCGKNDVWKDYYGDQLIC